MSIFNTMADAKSTKPNYVQGTPEGCVNIILCTKLTFRENSVFLPGGQQLKPAFILDGKMLHSTHPEFNKTGIMKNGDCCCFENMKYPNATFLSAKAACAALKTMVEKRAINPANMGIESGDSAAIAAELQRCFGESQPLANAILVVKAKSVKSKQGGEYTKYEYLPLTEDMAKSAGLA